MKTGVHGHPLSVPTPGPDDVLIEVGERDGGFSEYVTVPFDNAHAIETSLSDAELATFPTAYVTVERMLNRVRLGAGETIFSRARPAASDRRSCSWPSGSRPASSRSPDPARRPIFETSKPNSS